MIEFKGSHFERDVILWGVRWYVAYPLARRCGRQQSRSGESRREQSRLQLPAARPRADGGHEAASPHASLSW